MRTCHQCGQNMMPESEIDGDMISVRFVCPKCGLKSGYISINSNDIEWPENQIKYLLKPMPPETYEFLSAHRKNGEIDIPDKLWKQLTPDDYIYSAAEIAEIAGVSQPLVSMRYEEMETLGLARRWGKMQKAYRKAAADYIRERDDARQLTDAKKPETITHRILEKIKRSDGISTQGLLKSIPAKETTIARILTRLVQDGKIERVKMGYYQPKK